MKGIIITVFIILFPGTGLFLASAQDNTGWKAGVARVDITPKQNMWMAGYASRTKPADGILHSLWAKALFLEDFRGKKALLITTDLLGFPKELSDRIRNEINKKTGLSKSQIILSSSHTHSGPVLSDALSDIYPLDEKQDLLIREYSDWLAIQIVKTAVKASEAMETVKLSAHNGVVRFQVNRRNNKEAQLEEIESLKGPNDYAVPVIKIANKKGKLKAIVFGYACHPTVLTEYKWSGDYAGFAQLELEERYKGTMAMFFQGAGGDQNPLPRRSVALAKQYGKELAASVERILDEDMPELDPQLETAYREIELNLDDPPTKDELEKMESEFSGYSKMWAKSMLKEIEAGKSLKTTYPYPIQVWRLGAQTIIILGGELLVEYSINLKKIFGNDIFVMGYSNDVMAYIPSDKVLVEGGYEGESSQRVYGLPAKWKPGIEKTILAETVELARKAGISLSPESEKTMNEILGNRMKLVQPE